MDDNKKAVLVAALSAYAELLSRNTAELQSSQGKGKGKASDDDVDLESEIRDQIKLCRELTACIIDPSPSRDLARTFGAQRDGDQTHTISSVGHGKGATRNLFRPEQSVFVDEEPCINPFTGLPIVPETGFEAGPSTRAPPPFRHVPKHSVSESQKLPLVASKLAPESFPKQLSEPPPPWHTSPQLRIKQLPCIPPTDTTVPSSSPSTAHYHPPERAKSFVVSPNDSVDGLSRMSSVQRKPLPSKYEAAPSPSQPTRTPAGPVFPSHSQLQYSQMLPPLEIPQGFDAGNRVVSRENETTSTAPFVSTQPHPNLLDHTDIVHKD